jgi:hypothetical protein
MQFFQPADDPGWILIYASPNGRDCINGLFPRAHIEWRDPGEGLPPDWRVFSINLPDVVSATQANLPPPSNSIIDDCSDNQLAFLLATAVKRDGGRAAQIVHGHGGPQVMIYLPRAN